MAEAYNARSAELKALDKARSADPEWYKRGNMFGMTMYTDLFAGNLKELAKQLPYLKEQKLTYRKDSFYYYKKLIAANGNVDAVNE